jgi:AraC family transcriptional regulator
MPTRSHTARLAYGEFYGRYEHRAEAGGFAVARLRADPRRVVERHTHDEAHFVLVLAGRYASSADGAGDAPTLVYNPPGTTHRDTFLAVAGRVDGRFLSVSVSRARMAALGDCGLPNDRAVHLASPTAEHAARRLAGECSAWDHASPLVAEALSLELLAHAARARAADGRHTAPAWLRTARELLRDRCCEAVTVSDVAHTVGVHPVHLARTFRRCVGCTPGEYLRRARVERAAALLRDTRRPLGDVALSCGFADQSHFTKAFRRALGTAPGAYRRASGSTLDADNEVA